MSRDHFDLPDESLPRPTSRRQILALSGGGFRGLFTARLLEYLERRAGRPLRTAFDLIAGTSIGGVIAAALAEGVPAERIRRGFEDHGSKIFDARPRLGRFRIPLRNPAKRLYAAQYRPAPLRAAIVAILGRDACEKSLSSIETPLLITAVSQTLVAPRLFRSQGLAAGRASRVSLLDAALATAAAPTYFPPHEVAKENLVDGGLIANAPDLVGLTEAMTFFGCSAGDVHILSLGTATESRAGAPREPGTPGLLSWLLGARGLVQLTLAAQEQLAVRSCATLLRDRYLRIDATPSREQARTLALDRADPPASKTLELLAGTAIERLSAERRLRGFLSHHA